MTQKTVVITSLFLITVSPFCLVFAHAGLNVPAHTSSIDEADKYSTKLFDNTTSTINQADKYSTKLLDITFTLPLLNGMIQPIVYILSFENLRGIFVNIIFFKRSNQGQDLKMDIFRTAQPLVDKSGCEVEEKIPESPRQSPETRKSSVLSQVTILSEDESMALIHEPNPNHEWHKEQQVVVRQELPYTVFLSSESADQTKVIDTRLQEVTTREVTPVQRQGSLQSSSSMSSSAGASSSSSSTRTSPLRR